MPHPKKIIALLKNEAVSSTFILIKWGKKPLYSIETERFIRSIGVFNELLEVYTTREKPSRLLDSDGDDISFEDEYDIVEGSQNTVIFRRSISPGENLYNAISQLFSKQVSKPFLYISDRRKLPLKLTSTSTVVEFDSATVLPVFFYEAFLKTKDIDFRAFKSNLTKYLTEYYDTSKYNFDILFCNSDSLLEFCNYHSYFKFHTIVIESNDEINTLYLRASKIVCDRFIIVKNCIFSDPSYLDYNFENFSHGDKLKIYNYPKYLDQKHHELKSIMKYSKFKKFSEFAYPKIDQKLLNSLPIHEKIVLSFQPVTVERETFLSYKDLLQNCKNSKLTFEQTVNNALVFLNLPQCLHVARKVELEQKSKINIINWILEEKLLFFGKIVDRMNKRFASYRIFLIFVPLKPIKNKDLGLVCDFFYDCITNKTNSTIECEICILDDMIKKLSSFSGEEELVFVLMNGSIFDENKLVKFYMGVVNNFIHKRMSVNIVHMYVENTLEQKLVKLFYENLNYLLNTGENFKTIFKTSCKNEIEKELKKVPKAEIAPFDVKVALLDEDLSEFEWALLFDKSLILMYNFIRLIDDYQVETTLEQITGEKNEFGEKVNKLKREVGDIDKKLFTSLCLEYGFLPHVRREVAIYIYNFGIESENLTYLEKLNNILRFKLDCKFSHAQLGTYLRELNRMLGEYKSSPEELKSFLFDYDVNGVTKIVNIMKMYRMFLTLDRQDKFDFVAKKVASDPGFANSILEPRMGKSNLIQLIRNLSSLVVKNGRSALLNRKNHFNFGK